MAKKDVAPVSTISLREAKQLILAVGHQVAIMLGGEMGIGKTALLGWINEDLPKADRYINMRVDAANLSVGDLALPSFIDVETEPGVFEKLSTWAVNKHLGLHQKRPIHMFVDEYTKAGQEVKNALLPLIYDRELFGLKLPQGSLVTLTGNLIDNGLGDAMKGHERNRVCYVVVRKPSGDEWIDDYAIHNGIHPAIPRWVKDTPQAFASYLDGETVSDGKGNGNPYIYHPDRSDMEAVVTPRSLTAASHVLHAADRAHFAPMLTRTALAGLIGRSAAADLMTNYELALKLPDRAAIIADPKRAPLPGSTVACSMITFSLATTGTDKTISPIIDYMKRLDGEWQAVFIKMFTARKQVGADAKGEPINGKRALSNTKDGMAWALDNGHML